MQLLKTLSVLVVVGMAAGCSEDSPTAPAEVAAPGGGGSRAEERGEAEPTLKLTPPMPTEPADGHEYDKDQRVKALEAQAATGEFAAIEGVTHRFQVFKGGRRVVNRVASDEGETVRLELKGVKLSAKTTYQWRVRGENEEGVGPWSPTFTFTTGASSKPTNRAPDPPPGRRLPLPSWGAAVVQQVAAAYPDALRHSCQSRYGARGWEFLDRVVDALRARDTRFGYNGKRGNAGDPSKDVVSYHFGPGPDNMSTDVYIVDVLIGHCGSPSPGWHDVSEKTWRAGTIGIWISRGRF